MNLEFLATGDLGPARPDGDSIFDLVRARLQAADVVFGQLEPVLTVRGSAAPQARLAMRSDPGIAQAISRAGFDVISFASNHCMDWGELGLHDTIATMKDANVRLVGVGRNQTEARTPAVLERGGIKIGFLAYNSILPQDYFATDHRAGCAPLRAWTIQEQIEHDQPGTPSRTHSIANRHDLAAMTEDIRHLQALAHVVVVSIHWGIHFVPYIIADYQREIAHAAIDAGAEVVIGHHPHILKAVELYQGKGIFYSLGNFAIDPPTSFQENLSKSRGHREILNLNPNWKGDDKKLMLPDSCLTAVARMTVGKSGIGSISLLPAFINDDSQPAFLTRDDRRFDEIADHLEAANSSQGIRTVFHRSQDSLEIRAS